MTVPVKKLAGAKADLDQMIKQGLTGTDLTPAEEALAHDSFKRERQMWLRLQSAVGDIRIASYIDNDKEAVILIGNVFLQKQPRKNPIEGANERRRIKNIGYEMIIKDKTDRWGFVSDGTHVGTTLHCSDVQTSTVLNFVLHESIVQAMAIPLDRLSRLDVGDNVFGARYREEQFFKLFPPWHNPQARNKPSSFMFKDPLNPVNVFLFENGHFSYWGKGIYGQEDAKVEYQDYKDIDGFSFPTKVILYRGGIKTIMSYSNLIIHMAKEGSR